MAGRHWRSERHRLHALPFLFVLSAASSDACMRAAQRWLPSARTSRPGSTNRHRRPPNDGAPPTSIPAECAARLVLDDARLEEVLLLLEIDHLGHPWERVVRLVEQRVDAYLLAAPIRDEAQVLLEHRRIQAQHTPRHRVLGVCVLEVDAFLHEPADLLAE